MKNTWCVAESKRLLRVGTSAICPRRYRSRSYDWNGVHGEKFRKESKIHHSEIQVMECPKKFYGTRPKNFKDGKRKLGYKSFSVSGDWTKMRYLLLREARELIKNNYGIDFAFAYINCSLGFRYKNGSFMYFNSENKFHNLINK